MPLPYPDSLVPGSPPKGGGQRKRFYLRRASRHWVNILVCVFAYFEMGCPQYEAAYVPLVGSLNRVQEEACEALRESVLEFCHADSGPSPVVGGGSKRLAEALYLLE